MKCNAGLFDCNTILYFLGSMSLLKRLKSSIGEHYLM